MMRRPLTAELVTYLLQYHRDLLAPEETRLLRATLFLRSDLDAEGRRDYRESMGEEWDEADLARARVLGEKQVETMVAQRLWTDRADDIVLNLCPKCGGLARTPKACQCPHCFHRWQAGERGAA